MIIHFKVINKELFKIFKNLIEIFRIMTNYNKIKKI
jgi:hypothetical protein